MRVPITIIRCTVCIMRTCTIIGMATRITATRVATMRIVTTLSDAVRTLPGADARISLVRAAVRAPGAAGGLAIISA